MVAAVTDVLMRTIRTSPSVFDTTFDAARFTIAAISLMSTVQVQALMLELDPSVAVADVRNRCHRCGCRCPTFHVSAVFPLVVLLASIKQRSAK